MTGKQWYADQLLKQEWKDKRDEILKRDDYRCQWCGTGGSSDNPMNIHHWYYAKGRRPWEYPNRSLMTICKTCHKNITNRGKDVDEFPTILFEGMAEAFDMGKVMRLTSDIICGKSVKDRLREMVKE